MHILFIVVAVVVGLATANDKIPVFHARAEAPRLTREYAQLTNNTEILFEWHDSRIQQHLWKAATRSTSENPTRTGRLGKRAPNPPTPRPVGAPLGRGNCAGCANLNNNLDEDILSYNWQYMQSQMITARKNRLANRCVFYTGLPDSEKLIIRAALNRAILPDGQSDLATRYACSASLYTIWNLWPGKNNIDDQSNTDKAKHNFWEITEEESWLYRLSKMNTGQFDGRNWEHYRGHYFRAMSNAMAHSCRGTIYVMAGNTDMSIYNRGIWKDTEYPTLRNSYRLPSNAPNKVTRLILVKTLNPANEQYEMIFGDEYPTVGSRITKRDPDYLHLDLGDELDQTAAANVTEEESAIALVRRHHLMKRDSCMANLEYETADHGDWFGRGW